MLQVRKAVQEDLNFIMQIYHKAQDYMIGSGNPDQWGHLYPQEEMVRKDIEAGICHLIADPEGIQGVFALCTGDEPTYRVIEGGSWLNDEPYITIHRIASAGKAHGIFNCAADYCKDLCDNVRIDTHHDNLTMQRQIERNGFVKCGIIYVKDGSTRIAYHWKKG
ncbi:MAG: N-acetyltransferase [Lachnospiraceae bacterium]|nr:N-acetyltransferase [Lachnospiraceae bacterium]